MTLKFQRDIFIDEIYNKALKDRDIFFISADFGAPSLDKFREKLPKQFIHSGISEQHMIDMAAGLALSGKKVYVYAMAPFITLRCLEQIKCSLALMNLPVTIIAVGVGLGYADAGPTHYSNEDIACMRSIVGTELYSCSDEIVTKSIAALTIDIPKLRVIRLERHPLDKIHQDVNLINKNGYQKIKQGKEIGFLSYGHLLHRVIKIGEILKEENIDIGIYDVFRFKPISKELILDIKQYKTVITLEEQCLDGGFGSLILEAVSDSNLLLKIKRLGLPDRYFFENGGREYLLDKFGLSIENIIKTIKSEIANY